MTFPLVVHEPDGRTLLHLDVQLIIEPKDGYVYRDGALYSVNGGAYGEVIQQDASVESLMARVRDVLADVTKHDETIVWRVTDVEVS